MAPWPYIMIFDWLNDVVDFSLVSTVCIGSTLNQDASHHQDNYPPETNIAPENGWLEDYFPFGKAYFQGRTVSFRESTFFN